MPDSVLNFDIHPVARDFLFVEEFDIYPPEIWDDFREAFFLFLSDEEIYVLNARYSGSACELPFDERRRILSELTQRFQQSSVFSEMNATMREYEEEIFYDVFSPPSEQYSDSSFVSDVLARVGLRLDSGRRGNFAYDAMIGNFPVFVWRSREIAISFPNLQRMLADAANAGFARFFLVAHGSLVRDIPTNIQGFIPFTVVPWFDSDQGSGANERIQFSL